MKKILLVLSIISIVSLVGCQNQNDNTDTNGGNNNLIDENYSENNGAEEENGSTIYYKDGIVHVYFLESKRPKGKTISLSYELPNIKGDIDYYESSSSDGTIGDTTFEIPTSLKEILNNNVKLSCYIDGKLYTEKTVFIDKMFEPYNYQNDLVIGKDKSFEVKSRFGSYICKAVDENGKELKLFDITSGRRPFNTSFFGDKFIADDGYLYSFSTYTDDKNVVEELGEFSVCHCSKISNKKIVNYDLDITDVTDPSDPVGTDFSTYDTSITYQYEDGTNYTEKLYFSHDVT